MLSSRDWILEPALTILTINGCSFVKSSSKRILNESQASCAGLALLFNPLTPWHFIRLSIAIFNAACPTLISLQMLLSQESSLSLLHYLELKYSSIISNRKNSYCPPLWISCHASQLHFHSTPLLAFIFVVNQKSHAVLNSKLSPPYLLWPIPLSSNCIRWIIRKTTKSPDFFYIIMINTWCALLMKYTIVKVLSTRLDTFQKVRHQIC